MNNKGPAIFEGLQPKRQMVRPLNMNDCALIDEISGLNDFLRNHMKN